jgi:hypothetical protein
MAGSVQCRLAVAPYQRVIELVERLLPEVTAVVHELSEHVAEVWTLRPSF